MTVNRVISTETEDFKDPSVNPRPSSKAACEQAEGVSGGPGGSHLVPRCRLSVWLSLQPRACPDGKQHVSPGME